MTTRTKAGAKSARPSKMRNWTGEGRQWTAVGTCSTDDGECAEETEVLALAGGLLVRFSERRGESLATAMAFVPGATLHEVTTGDQ